MGTRGRSFAAVVAAAALIALAVAPAFAQENDCFTALRKDANFEGHLLAATEAGPVELLRERGYEWQAMATHPVTSRLWAWGSGPAENLFVYDRSGSEIASFIVPPLLDSTVDEILFLGDGRRMIGRGQLDTFGGGLLLFALDTDDPIGSIRVHRIDRHATALVRVGRRIVALLAHDRAVDTTPALVYDRRTKAISEARVPARWATGAHVEATGRLWLSGYASGFTLGYVENAGAAPENWHVVDVSHLATVNDVGGAGTVASRDGVVAVLSARGVTTLRDGARIGRYMLPAGRSASASWPTLMVADGGIPIFGGALDGAATGWLEARSPDLAMSYGDWALPSRPTWMAAD